MKSLEIELGNEAMWRYGDLYRAMEESFGQRIGKPQTGDYGTIRDKNGNTIGKWEVSE